MIDDSGRAYFLAALEVLTAMFLGIYLTVCVSVLGDRAPVWLVIVGIVVYWLALLEMLSHAAYLIKKGRR